MRWAVAIFVVAVSGNVQAQPRPVSDPRLSSAVVPFGQPDPVFDSFSRLGDLERQGVPGASLLRSGYRHLGLYGHAVPLLWPEACSTWASAASEMAEAAYLYGWCLESGRLGEPNLIEAAELYRAAAAGGYPPANCALGQLGFRHPDAGLVDVEEAAELCLVGAESGDPVAEAEMGVRLWEGRGVPFDDARALRFLSNAAAQENADAAFYLASIYWNGERIERDVNRSGELWLIAHNSGRREAALNLGDVAAYRASLASGELRRQYLTYAQRWYSVARNTALEADRPLARQRHAEVSEALMALESNEH